MLTTYVGQTGGKRAGCCTAALFLKSFVEGVEPAEGADEPSIRWAHIDIAGSMEVRLRLRFFRLQLQDDERLNVDRLKICRHRGAGRITRRA